MKYVMLSALGIGLFGFYLLLKPPTANDSVVPEGAQLPKPISQLGRNKLSEIRARITSEFEDGNELIAKTTIIFREMHALRTYAFREEVRTRLMDDLLQDEQTIQLAKRILIDHAFAMSTYKNDQAVARVYAIALLEHAAKTSGTSELLDTAQKLSMVLYESGDVSRGRAQDLDDLVYAYAKMEDADVLNTNLHHLAQQFALNEHTRDAVRNGLFYALKGQQGEEKARKEINSAFAMN